MALVLYSRQLLDIVYREETLLNVMRSVTRNGRSILLTAVLALVLVYMFSIVGYMFFRDHFLVAVDRADGEYCTATRYGRSCGRLGDGIMVLRLLKCNRFRTLDEQVLN